MLEKIITLRRNAAERVIHDASRAFGIPCTAGMIPKRSHKPGATAEKKTPIKISAMQTVGRIRQNVLDTDGTLLLSDLSSIREHQWVETLAAGEETPFLFLPLFQVSGIEAAITLSDWLYDHHIHLLNVVVSRGGNNERLVRAVRGVMKNMLVRDQSREALHNGISLIDARRWAEKNTAAPKTVEAAAELILGALDLKSKALIANMNWEGLDDFHTRLKIGFRKTFGEALRRNAFVESCRSSLKGQLVTENEAAELVLNIIWRKLKRTHRIRTIK